MNIKNNFLIKGSAGLIAVIVVAVLVIGGGAYFMFKKSPEQKAAQVQEDVANIGASIPSLDFSLSYMPNLEISSLNVAAPEVSAGNIFSAPSVESNFSVSTGNLDITTPSVSTDSLKFDIPSIPTSMPSGSSGSVTPAPSTGSGSQPSVDCSVFAAVPSCAMTGPGEAMCKQCFPNK